VPPRLLAAAARALGKADLARRLCGSLQVDIAKTRQRLGWTPPVTVDAALERTARDFLDRSRHR
jgi:nucleoside-diphosphate-sugar epimerase